MQRPEYDYLFKLKLLGDSGVGKSSLLLRFADDTFSESFISTIGVDFKIKTIPVLGNTCKLQIWDTAGQERFRTITSGYYRGFHAALICFDVTNPESFNNILKWIDEAQKEREECRIMLIATKCDLNEERKVSTEDAIEFCQQHNYRYIETSSKTRLNVTEAFQLVATDLVNALEDDFEYRPQINKPPIVTSQKPVKEKPSADLPKKDVFLDTKKQISQIQNPRVKEIISQIFNNFIFTKSGSNERNNSIVIKNYIMNFVNKNAKTEDKKDLMNEIEKFTGNFLKRGPLYFLMQNKDTSQGFFGKSIYDEIANILKDVPVEKVNVNTNAQAIQNVHANAQVIQNVNNNSAAIQQIQQQEKSDEPPQAYICPISLEIMDDPVITPAGQIYDRASIEEHIARGNNFDPMTREAFPKDMKLITVFALKGLIDEWKEKHQPSSKPGL